MSTDDRHDWRRGLEDAKEEMHRLAAEGVFEGLEEMRARQRERHRERHRDRGPRGSRGRDNVISCRLDDPTLDAVDTLVEAGVRATRADAVAWLIEVGLEANRQLLDELTDTVAQIRRLREEAASKARRHADHADEAPPAEERPAEERPAEERPV